jgi:hypothetical protein
MLYLREEEIKLHSIKFKIKLSSQTVQSLVSKRHSFFIALLRKRTPTAGLGAMLSKAC